MVIFSSAAFWVKAQNPLAIAPVGATELRVLSPSLLELTLVTTKDPDPAPVTRWNFVGANFALTLPSATEFNVSVNGNPVAVSEVGFRRRAIYAPLKVRDLRIGNSLFLKLGAPLIDGQTVSVRNPSGTLWDDSTTAFSAAVNPTRGNPAIHVNQVGYLPNETKRAMIGYYLGSMGELPIASSTFNIIDAASGVVRFTGPLSLRRDVGYTYSPTPYQSVYEANFSAFRTPGEYVLQVPGMGTSQRFLINEGTAAVFARALALGLYHQRCGGKNELPYTRHEHAACHLAAAEVPTLANTAVNATLASSSYDYTNNPLHTALQLNSVDASLYPFLNRGPIDVSGGHHDAGDYSKYTINSAGLIHHLVFAADAFPGVAALDNLGLPESGDGKSDLLQEAKWEADFLAKMQDADGGFYFLVYPRDRRYEDNVLPDKGDPQVVFPKTTAVTAAAVGALAEIASSPTFKAQFPNEAAIYLDKDRKGWAFLVTAINTHGKNGSYQKITHYGNEFMHDDELAWAAAAMFVATGDPAFHTQLKAWYDPSSPSTRRWGWWRLFEGYGSAARTYAFAARTGRLPAALLDPDYLARCTTEITAAGDDIARYAQENAYGTSFPTPNKSYRSAGWYFSSERAFELAAAHQLQPSTAYTDALISNMNYEGGCNPVNMPYITGLGWQRSRDIVHQYAQNDYQTLPPSGIPLGNIQAGFAYLENYKHSLGQLSYPPDGAWKAPYPFYDRWGDSFNTTTEFVVVDQARSLATYAYLLANTATAQSPYTRVTPSITGLPASIPAEQSITATFQAPGVDLTGARIVWEARGQQPFIGQTFTFSARDSGLQWLEAEALLPDGRRLICKTNFTATASETVPPNSFKAAPATVTSDIVALYALDGSLTDAAGKNSSLTLSGNARINDENLGWMANRTGQALRFDDLGDKATVSIPASLLFAAGTSEISLEAMVFIESYKGWNRSPAKLLCLDRAWNASLKWFEDTYSGPHIGGGTAFDCTGSTLASALPLFQWHHLRISISTAGYALDVNGIRIASASSTELSGWNSGTAILELGNFSGWIDEILIRRKLTPPAPSNLKATSLSATQVALTWTDNAANEQGYRVYRSTDGVNYIECLTTASNIAACTISALAPDTLYTFAVKSFNAAGESPAASVSARTLLLSPASPTGLAAKTVSALSVATGAVNLQWNANSEPDIAGYKVYYGEETRVPAVLYVGNVTQIKITQLIPGQTYVFYVTAYNTAGRESAPSENVYYTPPVEPVSGLTPPAPSNLKASSLSETQVALTWTDNATNEQGYRVYRSTDGVNYMECLTTASNIAACTISALAPDTLYSFAVKSFNAAGESAAASVSARTLLLSPASPTGLAVKTVSAQSVASDAVNLQWNTNSEPDIAGYKVYYGEETKVPAVLYVGNVTQIKIVQLTPGRTFAFYVTAYNTAGRESDPSQNVYYTPPVEPVSAVVKFLGADSGTGGTWKGTYGRDGGIVTADAASPPSYGTIASVGHSQWVWQSSTAHTAALQRIGSDTRLASCWYAPNSFDVEFRTSGTAARRISLYFLDWDSNNRAQKVELIDLQDGSVLNSQTLSNFVDGVYLTWEVTKSLRFRITRLDGANAVLSGIFFDSGAAVSAPVFSQPGGYFTNSLTVSLSTPTMASIHFTLDGSTPTESSPRYFGPITLTNSATVSARAYAPDLIESPIQQYTFFRTDSSDRVRFLRADLTRSGTWKTFLGSSGHSIANETPLIPSFATVELLNAVPWVWAFPTADPAALERPYHGGRIASTWYSSDFTLKLRFSDKKAHRVSLYFVDFDTTLRVQTVDVLDPVTGAILDRAEIEQFSDGLWLEYEIKEGADIRMTRKKGANAVLSGVFFD